MHCLAEHKIVMTQLNLPIVCQGLQTLMWDTWQKLLPLISEFSFWTPSSKEKGGGLEQTNGKNLRCPLPINICKEEEDIFVMCGPDPDTRYHPSSCHPPRRVAMQRRWRHQAVSQSLPAASQQPSVARVARVTGAAKVYTANSWAKQLYWRCCTR